MLGKASEIKTKLVYSTMRVNTEWNASKPTASPRYLVTAIDEVINDTLEDLGDVIIIQIQFQMSADNGDTAESALIIYKDNVRDGD